MTGDTTLLVLLGRAGDTASRTDSASLAVAIADALCALGCVGRCTTSVAGRPQSSDSDVALGALVEVDLPSDEVENVTARLSAMLDPEQDSLLEVRRRDVVTYDREWSLGEATPGERVVTLAVRAPSMTRDQFAAYWRDVHTGVALSYTVPPMGYTQFVTRRRLVGGRPEPDGVLVMSFRSSADRIARYEQHPDDAARGAADAAIFMNIGRTASVLMHETIRR